MPTKATVTELEVLFTANTKPVEDAAKQVEDRAKKIEKKPVAQKVDGDASGAMAAMDRVEAEAKKIVSAKTMATVDANIDRAETSLTKVQERLDYLRSVESTMEVTADIKRAESALSQIARRRDALVAAKETMEVDADTSAAEAALKSLPATAGAEGEEAGRRAGQGLSDNLDGATRGAGELVGKAVGGEIGDTLESALVAIPVAGGIILAAAAIGKAITGAIQDGLQVEVRQDRLQALTGIDEVTAGRLARAAGEAYANTFGESIEANMDTTRIALQQGLLDPAATSRDAQKVVSSLAGISDVLEEDVRPVSVAVTQLLRTGLAKSADEAFDLLATGAREGVNASEDLLDTFTEYPALFARLGLSGPEALGLINQGLEAGARNSDLAADALKEFQIRATDGSDASAAAFKALGLDAEDMTAKIAAGGAGAREGLDQVLGGLRAIEDPVARNAAAVGLFGTQAEDLGNALFAMDLSTAVDQLNGVTGAAQRMFDTLADNDATKIEEARRNIEVAAAGIQGALAAAFSEPIGEAADFVTENREAVMGFLLDVANGAFDAGRAFVQGIGNAGEAVGTFVAGPLADIVDGVGSLLNGLDNIPGVDTGDAEKSMRDLAEEMRGADESAEDFAATLEDKLIKNGIDPAQSALNEFAAPLLQDAALHDSMVRLAGDIDQVGYSAKDGAALVSAFQYAQDGSVTASKELDEQLRTVTEAIDAQTAAGQAAGQGQAELTAQYGASREALLQQLEAMGLTRGQAEQLISTYGLVPERVDTVLAAETADAQAKSDLLNQTLTNIGFQKPNPYVTVSGVDEGQRKLELLQRTLSSIDGFNTKVGVGTVLRPGFGNAMGNLLQFNAMGNLNPMSGSIARIVPPNTWRVVGDRPHGDELFAPLDGSARSHALMAEGARRMGAAYFPLADGSVLGGASAGVTVGAAGVQITVQGDLTREAARDLQDDLPWELMKAGAR